MGDAAALERVLLRVASTTDDAQLEVVLDKLLPLVIAKLDTPDPEVKGAALKILSHVNTRVGAQAGSRTLALPTLAVARLAASPSALVSNSALVYVDLAARSARPDPAARAAALPFLARGAAARRGAGPRAPAAGAHRVRRPACREVECMGVLVGRGEGRGKRGGEFTLSSRARGEGHADPLPALIFFSLSRHARGTPSRRPMAARPAT